MAIGGALSVRQLQLAPMRCRASGPESAYCRKRSVMWVRRSMKWLNTLQRPELRLKDMAVSMSGSVPYLVNISRHKKNC